MTRLIIPGYQGSPAGHWQHHWLGEDPDAGLVDQDDFGRPDLDAWLDRLDAQVARHPGAVLVGHSLGGALIAHFAARRPKAPVSGALIVAPADADRLVGRYPEFASFAGLPTAPLPFPAIVAASRNDPYLAYGRAGALAEAWGAGLVDLGQAGHVNIDSGHGRWAEGFILAEGLTAPGAHSHAA